MVIMWQTKYSKLWGMIGVVGCMLMFMMIGCGGPPKPEVGSQRVREPDKKVYPAVHNGQAVALWVNDKPVYLDEYNQMLEKTEQPDDQEELRLVKKNLIGTMVKISLIRDAALKADLPMSASMIVEEASKEIARQKMTFDDESEFLSHLAQQGLTEEAFTELWEGQVKVAAFIDMISRVGLESATEDEVRAVYDADPDQFAWPHRVRLSQILVPAPIDATPKQVEAATRVVDVILNTLEQNPGSFAQLAEKFSRDPASAARGGDMGFVAVAQLPPPLNEYVAKMDQGQVKTIRSARGYHIVLLTDLRQSYEQAFADIKRSLEQQKKLDNFEAWLELQRQQASVHVVDPDLAQL